jgi:cell division protein FtsL
MMGRSRLFLMIAAFCVGLGLFKIKYQVMALEKSHKDVVKAVSDTKETIHVLKAELTHLNDPERLQKLAINHLGFASIKPHQIVDINELPKKSSSSSADLSSDPIDDLMKILDGNSVTNVNGKAGSNVSA